jgi:hypothetical protein
MLCHNTIVYLNSLNQILNNCLVNRQDVATLVQTARRLFWISFRIRSPKSGSAAGRAIQARMLGGIQAGASSICQVVGNFRLNAANLPFDSSSAKIDPSSEHLVILSMDTLQPLAAAMRLMATTSVLQSWHLLLYPFLQTPTDPELSTQILIGFPAQTSRLALTHMSGPTSSNADSFLLKRRPSANFAPEFIFCPQGTKNQNRPPMPPQP